MITYSILIFLFSFLFFYFLNDLLNNCWELLYENLVYIFSLKTDLRNVNQKELKLDSLINRQFKRFYSKKSSKLINPLLKFHQSFLSKSEDILKVSTFFKKYEAFLNNLDKNIETKLSNSFLSK
jgi:hypothetical protein